MRTPRGLAVGAVFCLVFWGVAVAATIHEVKRFKECNRVFSAWHCLMWR